MTVRIGDYDVPDGVIILPCLVLLFGLLLGGAWYYQQGHLHDYETYEGIILSKESYATGVTARTVCLVELPHERVMVEYGCVLLAVGDKVTFTIHDGIRNDSHMKIKLIK